MIYRGRCHPHLSSTSSVQSACHITRPISQANSPTQLPCKPTHTPSLVLCYFCTLTEYLWNASVASDQSSPVLRRNLGEIWLERGSLLRWSPLISVLSRQMHYCSSTHVLVSCLNRREGTMYRVQDTIYPVPSFLGAFRWQLEAVRLWGFSPGFSPSSWTHFLPSARDERLSRNKEI